MLANTVTLTTDSYKSKRMLITLIEPAIEWIMKCIINGYNKVSILIAFSDACQCNFLSYSY